MDIGVMERYPFPDLKDWNVEDNRIYVLIDGNNIQILLSCY